MRTTMKKSSLLLFGLVLFFSVALPLHADDGAEGCVNSPENPTAILAAVGSAGAFAVSARARIKARRNSSK
jgi:XrtJ-associated TM-motif-TM protein